jgi:peroxiredoxin
MRDGASFTTKVQEKEVEITRSYTPARWTFVLDNTGKVIYKDTEVDLSNDNKKVIEFLKSLNE